MEKKRTIKDGQIVVKNPLYQELPTHEVTIFEIETSCGGSELLYDKMTRLIKSETAKTPADKKSKERYNNDSNLFVGRSLQEE